MNMNGERFPSRLCPVCNSDRSKLLFRQSFEQLSDMRLLDGYDVVICEECGMGFADRVPTQAAFDEYYRDLSKYEDRDGSRQPSPVVEQRFRDIAASIADFIPRRDASILEVGCASGGLLKALQERGFSRVAGADPSPGCVHIARTVLGIPAMTASLFTLPPPEEPYDFLILTGVLEHIRDLDRAVEQFHRLLRPAGCIYLEVPDASRYIPSQDAPFQEFSLEHINFFSTQSLSNLMQSRGFRLLSASATIRPLHEVTCPCTYGVFERHFEQIPISRDHETEAGLRAYVQGCQQEDAQVRRRIEQSIPSGGSIIVWGVGTHTLRLLATGGLDPHKIAVFVDSNPKYRNREVRGIPVVSPEDLGPRPEPILISTRSFQREIHDQIRHTLGLPNPVILLYGSTCGIE
jgi:SAM-dependent methyltransferase